MKFTSVCTISLNCEIHFLELELFLVLSEATFYVLSLQKLQKGL